MRNLPGATQYQKPIPKTEFWSGRGRIVFAWSVFVRQFHSLEKWGIKDELQHSALSTQHSALSTQHSALSTQHSALSTQRFRRLTSRSSLPAALFWRNPGTNTEKTSIANTCLRLCLAVLFVSAAQAAIAEGAVDCGTPSTEKIKLAELEARPAGCLQDPGWFDVGAGIAVVQNANGLGENANGNLITLRAYPFGRWYAPLKAVSPASTDKISAKLAILQQKAELAEQKYAALKADSNKSAQEVSNAQAEAEAAKQERDKAANDVAMSMQAALNEFGSMYAVRGESEESSYLLRRISFFYGRSIGGFDSNVVQGDINAFGLAYDIAPQFAVIWGRAYYNQVPQAGIAQTSASRNFFGIQLNLNAFKTMRNLTGSM